jgi:IS30 family transposase
MKVRWAEAGIRPVWFHNKLTVSKKHHRLCAESRKVIANLKQAGKTRVEIAQAIGFGQGTVSKELSRNHGARGCRSCHAERLAAERKRRKMTRPKVVVGIIKHEVEARLRIKHSPDQISKSPALRDLRVSHETIFRQSPQRHQHNLRSPQNSPALRQAPGFPRQSALLRIFPSSPRIHRPAPSRHRPSQPRPCRR